MCSSITQTIELSELSQLTGAESVDRQYMVGAARCAVASVRMLKLSNGKRKEGEAAKRARQGLGLGLGLDHGRQCDQHQRLDLSMLHNCDAQLCSLWHRLIVRPTGSRRKCQVVQQRVLQLSFAE